MDEIDSILDEYLKRDRTEDAPISSSVTRQDIDVIDTKRNATVATVAITSVVLAILTLFLTGAIQKWSASWLVSGKAPRFFYSLLERIAKCGSMAHRRSKRFRLRKDGVAYDPQALIDACFLYQCLVIDGRYQALYDYDVTAKSFTIEYAREVGKFELFDYLLEEDVYLFRSLKSGVVVKAQLPDELTVREMRYYDSRS